MGWEAKQKGTPWRPCHAEMRVRDRESRKEGGLESIQTEGASRASDWEGKWCGKTRK
jgi:hypothetical protein